MLFIRILVLSEVTDTNTVLCIQKVWPNVILTWSQVRQFDWLLYSYECGAIELDNSAK